MRKRSLGKTGIEVTELSLGTWGLSGDAYGPIKAGVARSVIDQAAALGVDLFETADSYGDGAMERMLGEALHEKDATVVTKWGTDRHTSPPRKHFDEQYLRKCAEESRKRLGERVRIVALLHNPSAKSVRESNACETMSKLSEEGLISSWGVSAGDEEVANAALDQDTPVLSLSHNILQVKPLRTLAETIKDQQVGVLAHSVLFYGLLAGRWGRNKTFISSDHRNERWPEGTLNVRIGHLDAVRPMVSGEVLSMRSAALRFVLNDELVSSVVLGPKSSMQLLQLIREGTGEPPYLPPAKLSGLEGRLRNLDLPR